MTKFSEKPLEKRQKEYQRITKDHPDRIPIIVENSKDSNMPDLNKKKFLVPKDLTVGDFIVIIRKRVKISPEMAIFLFVGDMIPPSVNTIEYLYSQHKSEDGFLYLTYSGENTFGC